MVARIYIAICMIAIVLPMLPLPAAQTNKNTQTFPGWPSHFQQQPLQPLKLSKKEKQFYSGFPGKAARFTDGNREIIMRWITAESRKLHSASDCFKGLGFHIKPEDLAYEENGDKWSQFTARKGQQQFLVKENISDGNGNQWTDVSSWYWAALLGKTQGPWWSVTVAQRI